MAFFLFDLSEAGELSKKTTEKALPAFPSEPDLELAWPQRRSMDEGRCKPSETHKLLAFVAEKCFRPANLSLEYRGHQIR
jgi:hypothetical protein